MTSESAVVSGLATRPSRRGRTLFLFAALGFALSPVLLDLARHLWARPWAGYAALFPVLLAWAARREREDARAASTTSATSAGWALVAVALALELVAVGGGVVRFGRPAVPLALVGLCRALGLASWRTALLALWIVPIPHFLLTGVGLPLATVWAELCRVGLGAVGLELSVRPLGEGLALLAAGGALPLGPEDGGLALAAALSGLGWLAGVLAAGGWRRCALEALLHALAAFPVQIAALLLAASALAAAAPGLAGWLLALGPWVAAAVLAVLRLRRLRRREEGA